MVAGIAHEINNPVSFIYGNIPYVEQYVQSLLRLIEAYETHSPETVEELEGLVREIELDFLVKDLPRILESMRSGANRIREIVLSLRSFSRLDEANCKSANINDGLDSTLLVLQSHIKPDIQIIQRYGDIPLVECYPRQLNQVFMNLLMNAIESLNHPQPDPKIISITTERMLDDVIDGHWVRITITDNGCGIPYDVQPKVFEPFFTTKKTGQGAGLGLTVSYQTVVNQHQGLLSFESEPGQGSKFVVEIPAKHSDLRVRNRNLYLFSRINPPATSVNPREAIAKRNLS
jgi:signal transduction histidine kinase